MYIGIEPINIEQTITLKNTVSDELENEEFCGSYTCWLSVNWVNINPSGCGSILCQWVIQLEAENPSIESTNIDVYCALADYLDSSR